MKKTFVTLVAAAIAVAISTVSVGAQSTTTFVPEAVRDQAFELSIRNIMRAQEHVGAERSRSYLPRVQFWPRRTSRYYRRASRCDGTFQTRILPRSPDMAEDSEV